MMQLRTVHDERIRILDQEHARVAQALVDKMQEMESTSGRTVKQLEEQRHQLCVQLEGNFREFQAREQNLRNKISQLEESVRQIHSSESLQTQKDEPDESAYLRTLLEQEQQKVSALTNEASAYKETISKADVIVENLEKEYKEKIARLEATQEDFTRKLNQAENELQSAINSSSNNKSNSSGNMLLVQELEDAEEREKRLRENLSRLESSEKITRDRIKHLESEKNTLESELQEYENVLSSVFKLKGEVESLKGQIRQQESDQEELQQLLHRTQSFHYQKENQLTQEIQRLKQERRSLELTLMDLKDKYENRGSTVVYASCNETHPNSNNDSHHQVVLDQEEEEAEEENSWL